MLTFKGSDELRGGLGNELVGGTLEGTALARQIALETQAVEDGVQAYHRLAAEAVERGDGASLKPAERLMLHWFEPLVEAIRQEQRECRNGEAGTGRAVYGPVLVAVDAKKTAVIVLHEAISRCMQQPSGVLVSELAYAIGLGIVAEASLDLLKDANKDSYKDLTARVKSLTPAKVRHWTNKNLNDPIWNRRVCSHLGAALLWLLQGSVSIGGWDEETWKVAFRHSRRRISNSRKAKSFFTMDRDAHRAIEDGHGVRQFLRPRHLPMIVKPFPWQKDKHGGSGAIEGGYAKIRTPLISKIRPCQRAAVSAANMDMTMEAVNAVSAPPWKVNHSIAAIVHEIIDRGGGLAGIPSVNDLDRPAKPHGWSAMNDDQKKAWKADAAKIHRQNVTLRSQRAQVEHTLSVLDRMQNADRFYFPHQLDFRGRMYPVPQHLNHHGSDLPRALLSFARPVDASSDDARYWIYVHAANCAGVDKVPFEERVAFVDDWMKTRRCHEWIGACDRIVDCAAETWAHEDIEDPFQFLAALLAIYDKEQAACLRVRRDGTCNAIQHMAALARDPVLAGIVNMIDNERPAEVYSHVTESVCKVVASDAMDRNSPNHDAARRINGQVTRKVLKRPIMTRNYSVTLVGARNQIAQELEAVRIKHPELGLDDYKIMHQVSMYLARETMKAIDKVCSSASHIMRWVTDTATETTKKTGEPFRWNTPLGFPVVQPYRRYRRVQIETMLQKLTIMLEEEKVPVWPQKHATASVPNVVHSFDAAHLQMVGIAAYRTGIDFAGVHDGDEFHAANVRIGDQIIRETFVELHSVPRLAELAEQWRRFYPTVTIKDPPALGTFDISNVLRARHFFM